MRFLGGQIVAYPLLHYIKQCFPNDTLTVVACDPVGGFYTSTPWVDNFIHAPGNLAKLAALSRDTQRVFNLHYSSEKYALICAARRVPVRLGFKNNRVTDFLWTHAYRKDPNEYLAIANLKLLGLLHPVDVHAITRDSMLALAQQTQNAVPQANVVLMPGGGAGEFKRWDIQSFVALTTQLKTVMGPTTRFCFVMGPDEQKEAAFVQSQGRSDIDIMMTRPLPEIATLVLNSQLVVANDCGPSHIAQNAGVPYVGLLHEPNPQWFWQRSNSRYVLPDDGSDNIKAVSVDNALRACKDVLAS